MFKAAVSSSWSPGDGEVDAASWERWMSKAKANSWCVGEVCVKIHFFLLIATTKNPFLVSMGQKCILCKLVKLSHEENKKPA